MHISYNYNRRQKKDMYFEQTNYKIIAHSLLARKVFGNIAHLLFHTQ